MIKIALIIMIMIMIMTNMISVVIEGGSHRYSYIATIVTMVTMTMPARRMKWKVE